MFQSPQVLDLQDLHYYTLYALLSKNLVHSFIEYVTSHCLLYLDLTGEEVKTKSPDLE